jgi:hypothetical protein
MYMQLPPGLRRLKAKAFLVNIVINTMLHRCILISRNSTFTPKFSIVVVVVVVVVESPMLTYTLF